MCEGLAAHLKIGNFSALASLTVYELMMEESSAAALIDGLNNGCRAVTRLSLGCKCSPPDSAERGLLVGALSRASENGLEGTARSVRLLESLQTLHLHWPSLTPKELLKFLFDLDINTTTLMPQPHGPGVHQPDFRPPFPALSSLSIKFILRGLPLETRKAVLRAHLERGVLGSDFNLYFTNADKRNFLAYLRELLPLLPSSMSVYKKCPFKINLGWRFAGSWRQEIENDWPPGFDIAFESTRDFD